MINNNNYKTLPIGTIFTYKGNKYKVCKDDDYCLICSRCAFKGINCDTLKHIRGNCGLINRTDYNSVYFVQINDDTTMNKDSDNISIINPIFNTNDSLNDLHVECPNGYSIDVEHSDLSKGIIKFKNDNIVYKDIEDALNLEEDHTGIAVNVHNVHKLIAIDKLINIAKYYNKDWEPNWNNVSENKFYIIFRHYTNSYDVTSIKQIIDNVVYFKNEEDAQAIIDNPNFKDILDTIYKD